MRRRSVVLVVIGALAGAPALARAQAPATELQIVAAPQGVIASDSYKVCVSFDRPVEDTGRRPAATLVLEPPAGEVEWFGTEVCADGPLRPATRYRVKLVGDVVALDGSRLAAGLRSSTFETERPSFELYAAGPVWFAEPDQAVDVDWSEPFTFGREALARRVRAYARPVGEPGDILEERDVPVAQVVATAKQGRRVPVDVVLNPERTIGYRVKPRGRWPDDARITVVVEAGVLAREGPLPSSDAAAVEFETRPVQRIVGDSCVDRSSCPIGPLVISTRVGLEADERAKITVEPRPERLVIEGDTELTITGAFLAGETYTVTIPGERGPIVRKYTFTRRPSLALAERLTLLDPRAPRLVGVTSRHLRTIAVRVARLDERRIAELLPLARGAAPLPWPEGLAADATREITLAPRGVNRWVDTPIDVAALAGEQPGVFLVEVRAVAAIDGKGSLPPPVRGLVQVSGLVSLATLDPLRSTLQLVRLDDGSPVQGATVEQLAGDRPRALGRTDARGFVELAGLRIEACPPQSSDCKPGLSGIPGILTITDPATADRVHVALPGFAGPPTPGLRSAESVHGTLLLTRGLVGPGETVEVVGWAAVDTPYVADGSRYLSPGTAVEIALERAYRIKPISLVVARASVEADGLFRAALVVPAGTAGGEYSVVARVGDTGFATGYLRIAETPAGAELRVEALTPDVSGSTRAALRVALFDVEGRSHPVPTLGVESTCRPIDARPPGVAARWRFGILEPERRQQSRHRPIPRVSPAGDGAVAFELDHQHLHGPYRCSVAVEVRGLASGHASYVVQPAAYLGIEVPAAPRAGEEATVTVRAFTPAGARTSFDGVTVFAQHAPAGVHSYFDQPSERCKLQLSRTGPDATCSLGHLQAGRYVVTASRRRGPETQVTFVVPAVPADPRPDLAPPKRLELYARRWTESGQAMRVLLRAPWQTGAGSLAVRRGGTIEAHPFVLRDGQAIVELRVGDAWASAVMLHATAVRQATASAPAAIERALHFLEIAPWQRRLAVEVETAGVAQPGGRVSVAVRVRDDRGRPVAGRVSVWLIDEAELHFAAYGHSGLVEDLLPGMRDAAVELDTLAHLRPPFVARDLDVVLRPQEPYEPLFGHSGGGGGGGGRWRPQRPLRLVAGPSPVIGAELDARGERRLELELPREAATFRVFAVASAPVESGASPGRFGVGEAGLRVVAAPKRRNEPAPARADADRIKR